MDRRRRPERSVYALPRQIGVFHERIAPAGASTTHDGPIAGEPAPGVEAIDREGDRYTIGAPNPDGLAAVQSDRAALGLRTGAER